MKRPILTLSLAFALVFGLSALSSAEKRTEDREQAKAKLKSSAPSSKKETPAPVPSTVKPVDQTSTTPVQEITPVTQPLETETAAPIDSRPQTQSSTAQPMAGEQIKWQVLSGGGSSSSSPGYKMSSTIGQTAAGPVSSGSYKINQGFWQNFSSGGCCIGTTGNVNKSVAEQPDLSDLSLLIGWMTLTPKPALPCLAEANVNGSVAVNPDLSDVSLLVSYLTQTPRPILPNCP